MIIQPELNAHEVWLVLLDQLLKAPEVTPRAKRCRERCGVHLAFHDAYANIIAEPNRKLNYKFMVAQWLTTLLGIEDLPLLERFNKNLVGYESDGQGGRYPSYGPLLKPQWPYVMQTLTRDPESRQAVMNIWKEQRLDIRIEQDPPQRSVPCTLSLQFLLRQQVLHTVVTMRSSDAWLGLPYDIYNFTMLANYLAGALNQVHRGDIKLGSLTMNLGSAHLYEEHWELARKIVDAPGGHAIRSPQLPAGLDNPPLGQFLFGRGSVLEALELFPPWREYACVLTSETQAGAVAFLMKLEENPDARF